MTAAPITSVGRFWPLGPWALEQGRYIWRQPPARNEGDRPELLRGMPLATGLARGRGRGSSNTRRITDFWPIRIGGLNWLRFVE